MGGKLLQMSNFNVYIRLIANKLLDGVKSFRSIFVVVLQWTKRPAP